MDTSLVFLARHLPMVPWTWTQHGQCRTCQQDCISFYTPTQLFLPVQTTRQTSPLKSHPSLASQSWLGLFLHLECFLPPLLQLKETHNTAWMATLPWLVLRLQSCPPQSPSTQQLEGSLGEPNCLRAKSLWPAAVWLHVAPPSSHT